MRNPYNLHSSDLVRARRSQFQPPLFRSLLEQRPTRLSSARREQTELLGSSRLSGLLSRAGVISISENMDTVGPFGSTVAGAVAVLDAIAAPDADDAATMVPQRTQPSSFLHCVSNSHVLRGARFGLPMKGCWELAPEACKAAASKVFSAMRRVGVEILEVDLPSIGERTRADGSWDWKHGDPARSE